MPWPAQLLEPRPRLARTGGYAHVHGHGHEPGQEPPPEASVTRADITAVLDPSRWQIVTAEEHVRTLTAPDGPVVPLHDVVVRPGASDQAGRQPGSWVRESRLPSGSLNHATRAPPGAVHTPYPS